MFKKNGGLETRTRSIDPEKSKKWRLLGLNLGTYFFNRTCCSHNPFAEALDLGL